MNQELAESFEGTLSIKRESFLLLVGSGISFATQVPRMERITRMMRRLTGSSTESLDALVQSLRESREGVLEFIGWFNSHAEASSPTLAHKLVMLLSYERHPSGTYESRDNITVVTTNWDRLFEKADEEIKLVRNLDIKANLRIFSSDSDLDVDLGETERAVYKIHGSPTYYTCDLCVGPEKYRHIDPSIVFEGDVKCRYHGTQLREPLIVLPGETIDRAQPRLWKQVVKAAEKAENILVVGYSGNSDSYIVEELLIPNKDKLHVVLPRKTGSKTAELVSSDRLISVEANPFFHAFHSQVNSVIDSIYDHAD